MTFKGALEKLGIQDFEERVYNSNSRGELFHIYDYIAIAQALEASNELDRFREWFVAVVREAEETHNRPASVFQHILKILIEEGGIEA